ncbi:MAG: S-DNA-T family DNA segregation ATPase FtsK/SpoIIIE, partial [Glaciecola sp.]
MRCMDISLYLPQSRCAGLADLTIDAADATVGDLVAALVGAGWLPAEALGQDVCIDGVLAPLDHGLEEVGCADGSTLAVGADTAQAAAPEVPAVRIGVAGGLDAGRWLNVGAGRHRIGRGADALIGDVTASERHATLDVEASGRVTVVDHGSRNGTWINGQPVDRAEAVPSGALLRAGAIALRVEDQAVGDAPRGNDRAFNRPPRPAWPGLPAPLRAPADDPSADGKRPTLPMASAVGGLAMGTMMFVMTGTLLYAAVAFMMPIMTVGAAMAARRRHGRDARKAKVSARREMADFVAGVARASSQVSARQRLVHPDVAEVIRRAQAPSIRLWERRPEHGDAGHLVLGHATRAWEPAMERDGRPSEAATHAVTEHAWLREVPVVAPGGVIGIVGDRDAALSVARSLVAQACVHQGPADLEAILVTPDVLSWDGAKWLPHLRDQVNGRPRACAPGAGRALLSQVLAKRKPAADAERPGGAQGADAATLLVILDGVETCEGRDAPGRAVLRGLAGNVLGIVVATSVDKLPASCDTVVVLEGRNGACRVTHPERGEVVKGVLASGISSVTLADTARALARFDDPEAVTGGDLPHLVALPDLFDTATNTPARVQQRWQQQRLDGRLRVPIGMTADGPLIIDLSADGPHALVAGTTGAGKSELLRSLVAGLAVSADPDHVAFVLIDYKGGAAFDRCSDLPHVAGLVTDLDDDLAERALVCLHAELHRRERLLRAQAVADLDAYRRLPVSREEPLPSLVVVIDEFATLATELPDFLDSLVGIAQRGRSLGVHLILATQRPSGVVSDDIRANTNLRIALRVQDRQDSTDVIEEPAAATLTRDQPGRAYVRLGPSSVVQMQSALVTGPARSDDEAVRIRPFGLDQPARSAERPASADDEDPVTDLQVLVDAVRGAFEAEGLRAPREPWPAPLPERLPLQDLATMFDEVRRGSASIIDLTTDATIVLGVADDPEHQRRQLAGWDVDAGSLLVAGMAGSGTTSTLLAAVLGAAEKWTCEELHVYGLDAGRGQLAPLVGLPQTAGVVRLGEDERVARLVDTLAREVEARRRSGDVA